MFMRFFDGMRSAGIPVSLREYLTFLEALDRNLVIHDPEGFYYLARVTMVKDEKFLDRFDRVFSHVFKGLFDETGNGNGPVPVEIPEEWLRKLAEKHLTPEERAEIEALGGFEKLMETLAERLAEQEGRHQGGNKWIGTAGTSPFGAYGYNPEGVRIGQKETRHRRAVKVWDKREFRNLDDSVEIGTRNIKVALRRLRRWARDGAADELDLKATIRHTAEQGWLDVITRPERRNAVKVLLFFDVGGSMDPHVRVVEELFSAARTEFSQLEYFYFHNCLYEGVWKDNHRRWNQQISTEEIMRTYGGDYRVIMVGDASMSPYEIAYPGGANEHWNPESGETWLRRLRDTWPASIWINPLPENSWGWTQSIDMISRIFEGRMYPLTLTGLESGIKELAR